MAYIPKHKINQLVAQEGEFVFKRNKRPYIGPYIETSDGKFYAGSDPYQLNKTLLLDKVKPTPTAFTFSVERDTKIYNLLKKKLKKDLEKFKPIPSTKPTPTKKDYEKYKFKRYFSKRINSQYGYFEIDEKTYKSIDSKKPEYDYNLYMVGQIEWAIVGDTRIININTLRNAELEHPGLSLLFKNLEEYKKVGDPGIFKKIKEWDPYKQEGMTSAQIRSAQEYTERMKKQSSPENLIDPDNYKLYNIEGRKYPNGDPVPNNLPGAYGLPKPIPKVLAQNQNCLSCYFNKGGLCTYWNANIRNNYWCAAWVGMQVSEITYAEFTEQVMETESYDLNTVSSIGDVTLDDQSSAMPISAPTSTTSTTSSPAPSGGGGGGY